MLQALGLNDEFRRISALAGSGRTNEAYYALRLLADPEQECTFLARCAKLLRSIRLEQLELRRLSLALLTNTTADPLIDVLRYWLTLGGFNVEIWTCPYGTMRQTILDPSSELYSIKPDIVWICSGYRDVHFDCKPGASQGDVERAVRDAVNETSSFWQTLLSRLQVQVIQNNAEFPPTRVLGNYEGSVPWGLVNLHRSYNYLLSTKICSGVTIFDLDYVAAWLGHRTWNEPRFWFHSKHAFSLEAMGYVAFKGAKLASALRGCAKKCLVLDLDNTLWGGVIGDDGIDGIRLGDGVDGEAFVAFQEYVLSLKNRGVILAVCSKNEEDAAKLPFEKHPDMRIHLEDIAVFRANWQNKADNIRRIAETLNIGLDSMVFVDDNRAERNLVRSLVPEVFVPELPEDPAGYIWAVEKWSLFETANFSFEDMGRNQMYRENALRSELAASFTDISSYLSVLGMSAEVGYVDEFHASRVSQLINKSNQFHLTGKRYGEAEVMGFANDPTSAALYFKLKDRFGDNGLVCAVVLREMHNREAEIDTWVMSCRVLSRGMEQFVCNEIVGELHRRGISKVHGLYVPTKKNKLVSMLFDRLGFTEISREQDGSTHWLLDTGEAWEPHPVFIKKIGIDVQR